MQQNNLHDALKKNNLHDALKKNNLQYGNIYNKNVLPKFLNSVPLPNYIPVNDNIYAIKNRVIFNRECITVDPENCTDADDGFSIYLDNKKLYLAIHIADPTHYIKPDSELFKHIINNVATTYPSLNQPVHLMPHTIVNASSLKTSNGLGEYKNAISLITEIDAITYLPIDSTSILFTKVLVKPKNSFSYEKASEYLSGHNKYNFDISEVINSDSTTAASDINNNYLHIFNISLNIASALKNARHVSDTNLNQKSDIIYKNGVATFHNDTEYVKNMKSIIEEFAIFANTSIGTYLSNNIDKTMGIFRTCVSKREKTTAGDNELSPSNQKNINQPYALYTQTGDSHSLINASRYTHFTSPIRRCSDCICHYLVKHIYFKLNDSEYAVDKPFDNIKLNEIITHIEHISKLNKELQTYDNTYRTIQAISNLIITHGIVTIQFKFTGFKRSNATFYIKNVNNFNISIPYCVLIKDNQSRVYNYFNKYSDKIMKFKITRVSTYTYYATTFPEFNAFINNIANRNV